MSVVKVKSKTRNKSEKINSELSEGSVPLTTTSESSNESDTGQQSDASYDETVYVDSISARMLGLEQGSILREMHKDYVRQVLFYTEPRGGGLSMEEAIKQASFHPDDAPLDEEIRRTLNRSVSQISWYELNRLYGRSPDDATAIWQAVKIEARAEFESGHRAASVFEPVHWLRDPWRRARYLGIRDSFIEQWKPQGGIDFSLIDQLTLALYLFLYWTEQTVRRTETEMSSEPPLWIQDRAARNHTYPREREGGYWDPPTVSEQEAVEHAAQMAERYGRIYHRTLRLMSDLRRYSMPVTINNPQQVNIAAEGGKQVNSINDKLESV